MVAATKWATHSGPGSSVSADSELLYGHLHSAIQYGDLQISLALLMLDRISPRACRDVTTVLVMREEQ